MKRQHSYFEKLSTRNEGHLNVVAVCDSFHTSIAAVDLSDSFITHFGEALLFWRNLFDFRSIADSHSIQRVTNISATADVIIVASERKEFPTYVESWMAMLAVARAGRGDRSGAMIALIAHDAPKAIADNLESTARQGCLDFLRINLMVARLDGAVDKPILKPDGADVAQFYENHETPEKLAMLKECCRKREMRLARHQDQVHAAIESWAIISA